MLKRRHLPKAPSDLIWGWMLNPHISALQAATYSGEGSTDVRASVLQTRLNAEAAWVGPLERPDPGFGALQISIHLSSAARCPALADTGWHKDLKVGSPVPLDSGLAKAWLLWSETRHLRCNRQHCPRPVDLSQELSLPWMEVPVLGLLLKTKFLAAAKYLAASTSGPS